LSTKPFPALDDKLLKQATANFPDRWDGDTTMHNVQDAGSAEIWSAAQNRRTEDLSRLGTSLAADIDWRPLMPHQALLRGLTVVIIAFALLASVSVAVQAKKHPQVALLPTASMPAVNVP
jgi:hypothetical protein